jgi:hypothetical protein
MSKKDTTISSLSPISLSFALVSLFSAYMYHGLEFLSYESWIPLPGVGYLRWDLALWGSLLQIGLLHRLFVVMMYRRGVGLMILLLLTAFYYVLPRPPYFYTRSPVLFHYTDYLDSNPFHQNITIHNKGLTKTKSHALAEIIYRASRNWTHVTAAYGLAHHYYGTCLQYDHRHDDDRLPFYSFQHGFGHYSPKRAARESWYRHHFPEYVTEVQRQLKKEILPLVRPLYAQVVQASSEQDIVWGDEEGLGVPTVQIRMPHIPLTMHPQTNTIYQRRFHEIVRNETACQTTATVQTIVIPLLLPYRAGLRHWTRDEEHYYAQEIYFQYGKVYQYPAPTVHAVLSSSRFHERGIYMVLEAMAMPCEDGRWIFFH